MGSASKIFGLLGTRQEINRILRSLFCYFRRPLATFATIAVLVTLFVYGLRATDHHNDFFVIWSWARFENQYPPELIYDHETQHSFLLSLDPSRTRMQPFPYPPLYLFFLRPFGWLSFPAAQTAWSVFGLSVYVAAIFAPRWQLRPMLLILLAPTSAVNLFYGQNGLLTAALMIGGIRLAPNHPFFGGILLGLLAYKPQFALLVGVALIAARLSTAAFIAACTVLAWVALSLWAFGMHAWIAWANAMPDFFSIIKGYDILPQMPTPLAVSLLLGADYKAAMAIQAVFAAASAAAVWFAYRHRPSAARTAALATASVLASPYAFPYDLAPVTAGMVLMAKENLDELSTIEKLLFSVMAVMPSLTSAYLLPVFSAILLVTFLIFSILRSDRQDPCVVKSRIE